MSATLSDPVAERRIVGALLLEPELLPEVTEHVGPADFANRDSRAALRSVIRIVAAGHDADVDLVAHDMGGDLTQARAYLVELLDQIPSTANLGVHVACVRDLAARRRLREALARLDQALCSGADLAGVRAHAQEEFDAMDLRSPNAGVRWRTVEELGTEGQGADWIVEGLIAACATTVVAAKPKVGKTTFVASTLAALERGQDVAGFPCVPTTAVCLSEEPCRLLRERCERFGVEKAVFLAREDYPANLPYAELLRLAADECERRGARLLVVDTFARFAQLERDAEKDAGSVQAAMNAALSVAARGLAVLLVHHMRKANGAEGDALRGSGALAGAADIIVEIRRTEEGASTPFRTLSCLGRYSETPTEPVVVRLAGARYVREGTPEGIRQEAGHGRVLTALANATVPLDRESLLAAAGGKRAENGTALSKMVKDGDVVRTGRGKKGDPYLYALPSYSGPSPSLSRPSPGDDHPTRFPSPRPSPVGGDGEGIGNGSSGIPGPRDGDEQHPTSCGGSSGVPCRRGGCPYCGPLIAAGELEAEATA